MREPESFTQADVDRLLGLADQFLEDWAEDAVQGGNRDAAYEERAADWKAMRPVLAGSTTMFKTLKAIASLCSGSSDPIAAQCAALAGAALPKLDSSA